MKIKSTLSFILLFLPLLVFSQGFRTADGQLLDANGNNFVMKGINVPLAWFQNDVLSNIKNIKNSTGSNTLRIVTGAGITPREGTGQNWNTPDAIWQAAVDSTIKNKMIPMLEVHNILGSNDSLDLKAVTEWWISKKDYLTRPDISKYILINIANEWGDWRMSQPTAAAPNQVYWRDAYITAVKRLRAAGITTTLVIDAPGYGQDKGASTLLSYASAVINADVQKNVLFSIHTYCEWNAANGARATDVFPLLNRAKIPFIVGELANTHPDNANTCLIPAEQIMAVSAQYNSGYLGWSWIGNGGGTEALDMSEDWAGTRLTSWGNIFVNSPAGTKTAAEASVFGNASSNKAPTVSITAPANNSSFQAPASITINALASDEDGKVRRVDFYQGSVKIGEDTSAPYSFTWANVGKGAYFFTAFVVDNENASGISNLISVLVTSANGNILANGDFETGSAGWTIENTAPGTGTMTLLNEGAISGQSSLKICPTNSGTADYHVLALTKAPVIKGETYELSFLAKADAARALKVGFQQNGGDWRWYTGADFAITTSAELYTYLFTADTTDPIMDIKFLTGLNQACVILDNLIFSSNTTTGIFNTDIAKSGTAIYPNPFNQRFNIVSDKDFRYEIRNQTGQLMETGESSNLTQTGASVPRGFYIVRVITSDKTRDIKIVKE